MRATMFDQSNLRRRCTLADDKTYKSEYVGSGTFAISKPKRPE